MRKSNPILDNLLQVFWRLRFEKKWVYAGEKTKRWDVGKTSFKKGLGGSDKAGLGRERGTKEHLTVQLANLESSRQTGRLRKCVWKERPESLCFLLKLEEWQGISVFTLVRETGRTYMCYTTWFCVSVVLSVQCCARSTRHRTSTQWCVCWDPGQGWSATALENGQTQVRPIRKGSCTWPGTHLSYCKCPEGTQQLQRSGLLFSFFQTLLKPVSTPTTCYTISSVGVRSNLLR